MPMSREFMLDATLPDVEIDPRFSRFIPALSAERPAQFANLALVIRCNNYHDKCGEGCNADARDWMDAI